jgi:Na+-driven multidrug efflux pump
MTTSAILVIFGVICMIINQVVVKDSMLYSVAATAIISGLAFSTGYNVTANNTRKYQIRASIGVAIATIVIYGLITYLKLEGVWGENSVPNIASIFVLINVLSLLFFLATTENAK